ncbi:hypothetical protein LDENG_00153150 [Lucifuga dentata]|nr:hypothetical protein LDENG_00153150 [Lucifuga dentata]
MTSLAQQLKRLALPQSDPDLLTRREVASLLFDPKDAAAMDRSTFYALGCTGLEELLGIEPAFLEFQDTLFSPAALTLERSVQSKEINRKLDAGISLFLARLCPYFLLRPAHKCMEWLVHRFHIHLYNADSLLACVLPYHDTNMFVKVLQLLKIRDATNRWNWLHCLQKAGVPLARGALVARCYTDLSFMDFICSIVTDSIQAYAEHSGTCSQLRVIFSFYASTVVSALDAVDRVSDAIVAKLLPYVQRGLKSSLMDYKAAAYMLVCQLAVKVAMESSLVDTLAVHVSKSLLKQPVLAKEGLGCLVVLLQNQKDGAVGPRAFTHLCSVSSLVATLQAMAAVHDVSPLVGYLLPHLVRAVFRDLSDESEEDVHVGMLESILQSLPLSGGLDATLARLLLDEFLSQPSSPERISSISQRVSPLVRLFEAKYRAVLDVVLSARVMDVSSSEQKRLFHHFLSLSTSSGKYQILGDSDTSLFLALKHPLPSVRVSAVQHLAAVVTSAQQQQQRLDGDFLTAAVLDGLKDDVPEVVAAAVAALQVLVDRLDPEHTVTGLLSLLYRTHLSMTEQWLPVLTDAVRLLSDPWLVKEGAELSHKAGWRLLPFLVITSARRDSAQLHLASCIAGSDAVAQHPLTLGWAHELDQLQPGSSDADFLRLANRRLISTLSRNLSNMEHFAKRDALEKMAALLEQRRGSSIREKAFFLVMTQALLQGLAELSETQHLLTAQRIYVLLERHLLDVSTDATQDIDGQVSGPASFSEALAHFLLRAEQHPGEKLQVEFSHVLMLLLRDFVCYLKCHDSSFKGEVWWNPEKLDTNTCCYLGLICRLFCVCVSRAGPGPLSRRFRDTVKLLVQVHLCERTALFKFLCVLWGYSGNHGDQLDIKVSAVLQTQVLYVGGALLRDQPADFLQELTGRNSPVVPSLIACLTCPVREVRRAALGALESLSGVVASLFQPMVEKLVRKTEEIIADASYVSMALGVMYEDSASGKGKTQQKKLQASMQQLLQSVQTPCCPSYTAISLLRALQHVNGEPVLSALLPVLDRLLEQSGPETPTLLRSEAHLMRLVLGKFNAAAASLLVKDQACLDLFLRALRTSAQRYSDTPSIQITALEQITKPFFSALGDEKVQQKLLSLMFDLLVDSRSPLLANAVSSVFKAIAVDGQLVANELALPEKPKVSVTVQQSRRSKILQRKVQESGGPEPGAVAWRRVTLILELLQHKKKLKNVQTLVPPLFALLARSLEASTADHSSIEYSRQLLLSCLLHVCRKLSPDGRPLAADVLDKEKFSVELVVQCVRASDTPQTHHHALLLLGAMATIFPEKVLLNIMPIFTFMGANVMRLDDAYSFRVIDRTVQTVIPALIKAHELSDGHSAHLDAVVTRIVHVFADALPHMPDHRRLPVLTQLITTLGPARFLWVLMLLLFKQHATQAAGAASEKDAALERDVDFWISVCCQFEVSDQISSLIRILHFLLQLPQDKDDVKRSVSRRGAKRKEEEEELIFSLEAHSSKELRHFTFLCVSFMAQLLGSAHFIAKVADGGDILHESLQQQQQQRLLEEILHYVHSVARCVEENADGPTAKFWRVLLNKAYDVLDKVNALLPTDTFITVMRGLMGNQLPSVRRKAMELLNNKLLHRTQWEEQQVTALLQLTEDLLSIVGKSPGKVGEAAEAEQAINRQTAFYSLKLLCRSFGSAHPVAFIPVLVRAVEVVTCPEEEKNVTGGALLCVTEVVSTLKALTIPQLPSLMPAVLHTLSDRKELLTNEIYLLSAVTALQRVTETLPHFISPYLQEIILQVCTRDHTQTHMTSCSRYQCVFSRFSSRRVG